MLLKRLISVLEAVAIAGRPMSASDLHEITGLPLPTCYRLLQMLAEQRLLDSSEGKSRYVIGERLVRIALLAKTDADVRDITAPILRETAIEFGEAVFLSRLRQNGVGIIHVEIPSDPTMSYIHPGLGSRPMHACSCSKVIAAFSDTEFRELILSGPMKSYTEHTRTNREQLEKEFAAIRVAGFAECVEEIEVGISSVAAPVAVENIGAVFSVGTIGSIRRFKPAKRRALGEKLIAIADKVGTSIEKSNCM
ncbi:MAG: IclR family transcriptional regulator [Stappiaceae bacterium]